MLPFGQAGSQSPTIDVGLDVDTSAQAGLFVTRTYNNATGAAAVTTWQADETAAIVVAAKVQ